MKRCEVTDMNKKKKFLNNLITYLIVILAFLICKVALSGSIEGFKMSRSLKGQLVPICVYIVLAVSLNLVVGISGELSLGHAGFMCIGGFSGVLMSQWLASAFPGASDFVRLALALLTGGVLAGMAGVLIGIPVLRLRGDYLAIVTLAFGEIIRNIITNVYASADGSRLYFGFLDGNLPGKLILKGPMGTAGSKLATFEAGFVLVMLTLIVVHNLINSRSGRAIMAIRDNRIAAESVGISVTKYKMMAFVTSAALAGMAGALFGLNFSNLKTEKFDFNMSINILVFVVLGGIGSIRGSVIAATVLTVLPELLREVGSLRMLVYAIVLIVVMIVTNNPLLASLLNRAKAFIRGKNPLKRPPRTAQNGKEAA